jgi:hypothetical protein
MFESNKKSIAMTLHPEEKALINPLPYLPARLAYPATLIIRRESSL